MAICPKCGMSLTYTDDHVCEGRDHTKLWLLASVAGGAFVGASLGLLRDLSISRQVLRGACGQPGAGNLCGFPAFTATPGVFPIYTALGAVIGAMVAAVVIIAVMRSRSNA
jgi:hypothetical protein